MNYNRVVFREFTTDSVERIRHQQREKAKKYTDLELRQKTLDDIDMKQSLYPKRLSKEELDDSSRIPDPQLEVGQTLPESLRKRFPKELIGKPIEEIDPYYATEEVSSHLRRYLNRHPSPDS